MGTQMQTPSEPGPEPGRDIGAAVRQLKAEVADQIAETERHIDAAQALMAEIGAEVGGMIAGLRSAVARAIDGLNGAAEGVNRAKAAVEGRRVNNGVVTVDPGGDHSHGWLTLPSIDPDPVPERETPTWPFDNRTVAPDNSAVDPPGVFERVRSWLLT